MFIQFDIRRRVYRNTCNEYAPRCIIILCAHRTRRVQSASRHIEINLNQKVSKCVHTENNTYMYFLLNHRRTSCVFKRETVYIDAALFQNAFERVPSIQRVDEPGLRFSFRCFFFRKMYPHFM